MPDCSSIDTQRDGAPLSKRRRRAPPLHGLTDSDAARGWLPPELLRSRVGEGRSLFCPPAYCRADAYARAGACRAADDPRPLAESGSDSASEAEVCAAGQPEASALSVLLADGDVPPELLEAGWEGWSEAALRRDLLKLFGGELPAEVGEGCIVRLLAAQRAAQLSGRQASQQTGDPSALSPEPSREGAGPDVPHERCDDDASSSGDDVAVPVGCRRGARRQLGGLKPHAVLEVVGTDGAALAQWEMLVRSATVGRGPGAGVGARFDLSAHCPRPAKCSREELALSAAHDGSLLLLRSGRRGCSATRIGPGQQSAIQLPGAGVSVVVTAAS